MLHLERGTNMLMIIFNITFVNSSDPHVNFQVYSFGAPLNEPCLPVPAANRAAPITLSLLTT